MIQGITCFQNGDEIGAWTSFESAQELAPEETRILEVHGYLRHAAKQNDKAREIVEKGLALDPKDAELWVLKGRILNSEGKYTESGTAFDRAQELNPDITISITERFPINLIIRQLWLIIGIIGFTIMGLCFYFWEMRPVKRDRKRR